MPTEDIKNKRASREAGYKVEFAVGRRCLVQFEPKGQKYTASIIGIEPFDFFIVRLPLVPGIQKWMTGGGSAVVRMEQGGTLYGFTSDILAAHIRPAPMLMLSYPENVEYLQLREHKRTRCMLPVELVSEFFNASGFVTDLSLGGCRAVIDWHEKDRVFNMMSGDNLELHLPVDGVHTKDFSAQLMNLREGVRQYALGLRFVSGEAPGEVGTLIERLERVWAVLEQQAASAG